MLSNIDYAVFWLPVLFVIKLIAGIASAVPAKSLSSARAGALPKGARTFFCGGIYGIYFETVLGKIDPSNIGKTDAHDHLIRKGGVEVHHQWEATSTCPTRTKPSRNWSFSNKLAATPCVEMTPIGSGRSIRKPAQ